MKIAITGATGNMGREVMKQLLLLDGIDKFTVLSRNEKRVKELLKILRKHLKKNSMGVTALGKIESLYGSLGDKAVCEKLVGGAEYILNIGGVIPPASDKNPKAAIECNEKGLFNLIEAAEKSPVPPAFIHISTVAVYGNRNSRHMWGRVGDPLLLSPLDIYSATKVRGEFRLMNSRLEKWAVLRQTAMLHDNMLSDNISDGLMFHTCFNAPLEWVTAHDSGVLLAEIVKKDMAGKLNISNFWKKCFNIGGGEANRLIGFDTLNDGFAMIGGSAKHFFDPSYNATRNFHGVWFADGEKLDELFHYISQDTRDYWKNIAKKHKVYALGKIVPRGIIKKFVVKRLLSDHNSPWQWHKSGDTVRMKAFFGGADRYEALPKKWEDFPILSEGRDENGEPIDYEALKRERTFIDYGFDFEKADGDIDIGDLKNVAAMHGGELLESEFETGDMYRPLRWRTQDGEEFEANAYCVLRGGHWYTRTYRENVWDYDRLAKKDKIFAQIWYDSHDREENVRYYLDENFKAGMEELPPAGGDRAE